MARLSIEIASDNDLLVDPDDADMEVNDILHRVRATIYEVANGTTPAAGVILDSNGAKIGKWSWTPGTTEGK